MTSKRLTVEQAADRLLAADRILLLAHQYPDGDTIGSCAGLCLALQALGKQAQVRCHDPIPEKYAYMTDAIQPQTFEPAFICTVDVADPSLLGPSLQTYGARADFCIDHHDTNVTCAREKLLDTDAAATAMLIYRLLPLIHVPLTPKIAQCIYTGIATDTGCFKYGNTSPEAHRIAADCIACGIPYTEINRTMFDIKSRARLELERRAMQDMRFYYHDRCAVMTITQDMIAQSGAGENDLEGLPPLPRQIEGVWVGVTLREKADGSYKISLRTGHHANAAAICRLLGGGGHAAAAGCTVSLPLPDAIEKIVTVIGGAVPGIRELPCG